MAEVDELCALLAGKSEFDSSFRGDCHAGLQQQVLQIAANPDEPLSWPFYSVTLDSEESLTELRRSVGAYVRFMERDRMASVNRGLWPAERRAVRAGVAQADVELLRRVRALMELDVEELEDEEPEAEDDGWELAEAVDGPVTEYVASLAQAPNGTVLIDAAEITADSDPIPWG